MITRKHIEICKDLYRMQETAKFLAGDSYQAKIEEYKRFVRSAMKQWNCDELHAFIVMGKDMHAKGIECGITLMWLGAAVVELLEAKG